MAILTLIMKFNGLENASLPALFALFNSCSYAICQRLQFLGRHLDMVSEIEVAWFVERHEMDVHMWHIDAHHSLAHLDTRADLFEALGHSFGEKMQFSEKFVIKVKDVVNLLFGDAEDMTANHRIDIEESETMFGFGDLVAGNFACHNLTEDTCQNYLSILVSSKVILPAGTFTSTMSPTLWPRKAEAKGEVMLILPCLRLASLSGTMVYF